MVGLLAALAFHTLAIVIELGSLPEQPVLVLVSFALRVREIGFDDIKRIQNDPKTLAEIRSALQELTHGTTYNTWDKTFSGPR